MDRRTLFTWFLEEVRGWKQISRSIEKLQESPLTSKRRTFEYLWFAINKVLDFAHEEVNWADWKVAAKTGGGGLIPGMAAITDGKKANRTKAEKKAYNAAWNAGNADVLAAAAKGKGKSKGGKGDNGKGKSKGKSKLT